MSKRTIPRLALATLSLGAACGSDGDGGGGNRDKKLLESAGQDATSERADAVADAVCKKFNECAPDEFRRDYTSVQACADDVDSYFNEIAGEDEICKDALLDYYGCFARLGCEAIADAQELDTEGDCDKLGRTAESLCVRDDDDDYDDYDYDDYDDYEDY